ncbi:MAG: hypothetical protein WBC63_07840 [Candidatus Bipolaricaulia bacterium]
MKRRWVFVGCALVIALLLSAAATTAATSLFGTRFKAGETVQFSVEDSTTWWWGCSTCEQSLVLGWRITNTLGQAVYSVVHDAPVSAATWLGTWTQTRLDGTAVSPGQYILYVDTSVGTMSRCFTISDPCGCGYGYGYYAAPGCSSCTSCDQLTSITTCGRRTSLVFVGACTNVNPFFGLFGGCYSSPCTGCSTCP